ncbi:hypothetical protein C8F04DRAFT_1189206 [Mycena alexandri]|uniref:Uncharacterized protein n=1 Tax=Mycena alexandri TaxID=1745969 RepID=A0AAD6SIJ7_9AGAR|nr:hypothetical protein C8F04DRAFT_1189206 [Mycena alexandri]
MQSRERTSCVWYTPPFRRAFGHPFLAELGFDSPLVHSSITIAVFLSQCLCFRAAEIQDEESQEHKDPRGAGKTLVTHEVKHTSRAAMQSRERTGCVGNTPPLIFRSLAWSVLGGAGVRFPAGASFDIENAELFQKMKKRLETRGAQAQMKSSTQVEPQCKAENAPVVLGTRRHAVEFSRSAFLAELGFDSPPVHIVGAACVLFASAIEEQVRRLSAETESPTTHS